MSDFYPLDVEPGLQSHMFLIEAYAVIGILDKEGYAINEQQKSQIKQLLQREGLCLQDIVAVLRLTKRPNDTWDRME